ncbi:hypothetical protein Tco_1163954 [Tanacetum coccineum]
MRRVGKGFSGRETPLFPTMMVQAQEEIDKDQEGQRERTQRYLDLVVLTTMVMIKAVYEEMNDSLERAATTATCLDAEQDSGNINKTQSKVTPNEPSSLGTSLGGGPRSQETMGNTIARTRFKNVSKTSNDSLLTGVNTPRSDEDRLKINEVFGIILLVIM